MVQTDIVAEETLKKNGKNDGNLGPFRQVKIVGVPAYHKTDSDGDVDITTGIVLLLLRLSPRIKGDWYNIVV
jgi:hypothetical protein